MVPGIDQCTFYEFDYSRYNGVKQHLSAPDVYWNAFLRLTCHMSYKQMVPLEFFLWQKFISTCSLQCSVKGQTSDRFTPSLSAVGLRFSFLKISVFLCGPFSLIYFIILFIFGCAGSSLLRGLFSSYSSTRAYCSDFPCCGGRALGCSGFSNCSPRAPEHRLDGHGSRA